MSQSELSSAQSNARRLGRPALPRLTVSQVLCITVMSGILMIVNINPIRPNDFWWHLQAGREIVATGHIPTGEGLSYTAPGVSYDNYKTFWLMEAAFYLLYRAGGLALVAFVHSLVIASAYGLLLWLCRRIAGDWRVAYQCLLLAAAVSIPDSNVRPQAIAFPIGVAFLCAIYELKRRPRAAWYAVFPLGMLVWVNSHGSFVIGLLLLGIWLADEVTQALLDNVNGATRTMRRVLPPAMALGLALVACFANPRGPGIFGYLGTMLGNSVVQGLVPEWAPPSFATMNGAFFLTLLLLIVALLLSSARRLTFFQLLMFLAFAALALKTSRVIVWFGFVIAPILADQLPGIGERLRQVVRRPGNELGDTLAPVAAARVSGVPADRSERTRAAQSRHMGLNYVLAGGALVLMLLTLPWFKGGLPLPAQYRDLASQETPVAATDFLLAQRLPGRLFHGVGFGSYLIWAAQPAYPVFIDARFEMYPVEVVTAYLRISNAIGNWEQDLQAYGVNTLMLSPQDEPAIVQAARGSANWSQVYADAHAVIFVRKQLIGH